MSNKTDIFTPKKIVLKMLDEIDYKGKKILNKKIIDNSCGQGAFLKEIIKIYIKEAKKENYSNDKIKKMLESNIFGIEIEKKHFKQTLINLDNIVEKELPNLKISWKIINQDALKIEDFNFKMDYVVGNPPYLRIHNMKNINYKDFSFSNKGMSDLYLIFFEIGIKMLNNQGKLGYITPNSYFYSLSAKELRFFLLKENMIHKIINFESTKIFSNADTYTAITLLSKNKKENSIIYNSNNETTKYTNTSQFVFTKSNIFIFSKMNENDTFKKIINDENYVKHVEVKNGFATNCNNIFIPRNNELMDLKNRNLILNAVKIKKKGCSFEKRFAIFPYKNNKILELKQIKKNNINVYKYLMNNQELLKNRKISQNQNWWEYSKTQGINDLNSKKIIISNIIDTNKNIHLEKVSENVLVYGSGYYIKSKKIDIEAILNIFLINENLFKKYLHFLNKCKGSNYYFFTSKELEKFLNYLIEKKIKQQEGTKNE
ncbi:HsdM family class I SAM-dependent methyltransferase [Mesoplasma chauliocola]|nr:Eco57I restriction-modification methylase domain-containing protein [Mesoplasma chauliocola]